MKTYGTLLCPGCGEEVQKTSPNLKRCKPCALRAHGQTGYGYAEKTCIQCTALYKPTSSSQKVCANCTTSFHAAQNVARLRALRVDQGVTPVGSMLLCEACGDDFEYRAGPQKRCPDCQKTIEVARIHAWQKQNKDKLQPSIQKAKDNYNFSGNRVKAMERDGHTCQHCGSKSDLHVHHMDGNGVTSPRETRNNVLENLITLCRGCHTKEHHRMRHSSWAPHT